jgi:transcriptional regulator with XRE-family HTH domain
MTSPVEKRIGAAIRAARKARGITQSQLAAEVGLSPGTIGNYERGTYVGAHLADLQRVCLALGLDPDDPAGEGDRIRSQMPRDVQRVLDLLGGWLTALPEDRRNEEIDHLTNRIFG